MLARSSLNSELLGALDANTLILTPNSRLARRVHELHNQHRAQQAPQSWLSPRLHAISHWIEATWQGLLDGAQLAEPATLIDRQQEQYFWNSVIADDPQTAALVNPAALAAECASAHRSLLLWRLTAGELQSHPQVVDEFSSWLEQFGKVLRDRDLVTLEQAQQRIVDLLRAGVLKAETRLIALGFDDLPPLTRLLLDIAATEVLLVSRPTQSTPGSARCIGYDSEEQEIQAAARWAAQTLKENPEARIGIITAGLGQSRQAIEGALVAAFEPHYCLPQAPRYTLPFNFSAGIPLAATALIQDALQLLRLNSSRWLLEDLIQLFNSPFWGIAASPDLIDQLAMSLLSLQREWVTTSLLRNQLQRLAESGAAATDTAAGMTATARRLNDALQTFETLRRRCPRRAPPSHWAELFARQLHLLQWPGSRTLDSIEYQQRNHWLQLLERFAGFDICTNALPMEAALDLLGNLAGDIHFQARTADSPVQILGPLEVAGQAFTHCRVLGVSENTWPATARPNPLLPVELQRRLRMPHADADREYDIARSLTQHYLHSASHIVFSYPRQQSGGELQPSPLIAHLPRTAVDSCPEASVDAWSEFQMNMARHRNDRAYLRADLADPVSPAEAGSLRGGSRLLQNQANLPMAAFAIHRLRARQPRVCYTGLSPLQRGQLVHDCLAQFWQMTGGSTQLRGLSRGQLEERVTAIVNEQVRHLQQREPLYLGRHLLRLEANRIGVMLLGWLETELQRDEFRVIAVEEEVEANFHGLPLRMRLDRRDRLESGGTLILDYKTGKARAAAWGGERPADPQLPLYCLCLRQAPDAIALAIINASDTRLEALGRDSVNLPGMLDEKQRRRHGLDEGWDSLLEHWQEALKTLAVEFLQGYCAPRVYSRASLRAYEHLRPLLRLDEQEEIQQQRNGRKP